MLTDNNGALMLDANSVAGMLQEIFAVEMTVSPTQCANCGREGQLGSLLAFVQAPGVVLRCPVCESIVLRVSKTPQSFYLDARGAVYLSVPLSV